LLWRWNPFPGPGRHVEPWHFSPALLVDRLLHCMSPDLAQSERTPRAATMSSFKGKADVIRLDNVVKPVRCSRRFRPTASKIRQPWIRTSDTPRSLPLHSLLATSAADAARWWPRAWIPVRPGQVSWSAPLKEIWLAKAVCNCEGTSMPRRYVRGSKYSRRAFPHVFRDRLGDDELWPRSLRAALRLHSAPALCRA
jgi:hypothetical protein